MTSVQYYDSPLGRIRMAADEIGLTVLCFEGAKYDADRLSAGCFEQETEILSAGKCWLDMYFSGKNPDFLPPLHSKGSAFQMTVWDILLEIPYGETVSYGEIARKIAEKRGISRMSAQAVGGAVGHNPIAIIIPCHRVVGSDGSMTGYAGGIDKKIKLLELEHSDSPLNLHFPYAKPTAIGGLIRAELDLELKKGIDSLQSFARLEASRKASAEVIDYDAERKEAMNEKYGVVD